MGIPRFPADGWIALRGIALFLEIHQYRMAFRLLVQKPLFQTFNLSRPQDFEGHSLSVSDVIALKRNGEVSVHYVDSIGFKDLQGFLDKKPERASVLMNLKEKCDAPECNPTVCRKVRAEHEL